MSEGWTVQVIPEDGARSRTVRVSRGTVTAVLSAAGLLAVLLVTWLVLFAGDTIGAIRTAELREENRRLEADLEAAEQRTGNLTRSLDVLANREERFRLVAGLPLIDPDIREVGVGGPSTRAPRTRADAVSQQLDQLLRRAGLLSASISEATDSMRVHRDVFLSRPSIRPVASEDSWISSSYSRSRYHPILLHNRPHTGIDISARHGAPILAAARGRITYTGRMAGYGKMVEVTHGYGYRTRYAHAASISVRRGERVERGEVIGEVGDTGLSTGPHVHYEVIVNDRYVDPRPFMLGDRLLQ